MQLKRFALAVAAGVALMAAPAAAETINAGYIDGSFTYLDAEAGGVDSEAEAYGVHGAVSFPLTERFGAQIDGGYAYVDADGGDVDQLGATGHVFFRTDQGLIGGFVGVASLDNDTVWGGGVEGDYYYGAWTIGGRATYAQSDDFDADVAAIEGDVTYFYTENFSIEGGVGFGNIDPDLSGVDDSNFYSVGVNAEYRFETFPGSVFGGVRYLEADDLDTEALAVGIGFRWNFMDDSLFERDRNGASQKGFQNALSGLF